VEVEYALRVIIRLLERINLIALILSVFIVWNIIVFALFAWDKQCAIKHKRRIPEGVLICCALLGGGIGAYVAMKLFRHKRKPLKFKLLIPLSILIACIPLVHVAHALTLDRIVVYREIRFSSENWPSELDGYRIGFMSDFHAITLEGMQEIADELSARDLDLLVLGGDFSSVTDGRYRETLGVISTIYTRDGIFGVEGNHDDYVRLFAAKEDYGIVPLSNSGSHIRPHFFLAGVEDYWLRSPNIGEAIAHANEEDFIILITHNPDLTMSSDTSEIDLILSGHTHGGQITFFGWAFYLYRGSITNYHTRFARGWSESYHGVPVYTSVGVGPEYEWPRVFARPEVIIFTMYSA